MNLLDTVIFIITIHVNLKKKLSILNTLMLLVHMYEIFDRTMSVYNMTSIVKKDYIFSFDL